MHEAEVLTPGRGRPSSDGAPLSEVYWRYFKVLDADTPDLRQVSYRLRYQVYCVEHPFEPPNPNGIEVDPYDEHSGHALLIQQQTGLPAGTVRMVLPDAKNPEKSFAFQDLCTDPAIRDHRRFPIERAGEISRFCVSKQFRQRIQDRALIDLPANSEFNEGEMRRVIPNMTLGLIQWLVRFSRAQGLTHWCAVMEPHLLRLLARLGIHFEPKGEVVEFHGRRQPCVAELEPMLARVKAERPDIWEVIASPAPA